MDNELKTAKLLFRKTAEELKLYSKDVEIISSSLSEIAGNEEMLSHYSVLSPCLHNGTAECQWWRSIGEEISFTEVKVEMLFRSKTDPRYQPPCSHPGRCWQSLSLLLHTFLFLRRVPLAGGDRHGHVSCSRL